MQYTREYLMHAQGIFNSEIYYKMNIVEYQKKKPIFCDQQLHGNVINVIRVKKN